MIENLKPSWEQRFGSSTFVGNPGLFFYARNDWVLFGTIEID